MGFWWGLIIGIFAGANIGVVIAGLLAGSKREESSQDLLWDRLHMDEAVMDERTGQGFRGGPFLSGCFSCCQCSFLSPRPRRDSGFALHLAVIGRCCTRPEDIKKARNG